MKEDILDILLVEDCVEDVDLTQEAFKEGRIKSRLNIVDNGIDAMDYLRQEGKFKDCKNPDLILLDLNLPKKNGFDVLREIKEDSRLSQIPLVILSTSNPTPEFFNVYGLHPFQYVRKSADFDPLIHIVKQLTVKKGTIFTELKDVIEDKSLKILIVEDSLEDFEFIREILSEKGTDGWDLIHCQRLGEALKYLEKNRVDSIVLDLYLPDSHGFETLRKIRSKKNRVPVIILTGLKDETLGVDAIQLGAQDFLVKGQITAHLFSKTIQYAIEREYLEKFKDELISYVNHELSNPLMILKGVINQITHGMLGEVNQEQKEYLEVALASIERLDHILEQMMDCTKLELGMLKLERKKVDMVQLVNNIIQSFKPACLEKGLLISGEFSCAVIEVDADEERLIQIFNNLMTNALKFTKKGSVTISVKERNEHIECAVKDTGCGIDQKYFSRIFRKFERVGLSNKGVGLGLFICKELVELHGGEIFVESQVGIGTKFIFTLPKS